MSDNFRKAVARTLKTLEKYQALDAFSHMKSISRTTILGVHDENTDWDKEIEKAKENFDSFDKLKRHCAWLIRKDTLNPDLKEWIISYLEDRIRAPKRPSQRPETGSKINLFFGQIVMSIANEFKLYPTRNEASEELSACDAVGKAINLFNQKYPQENRLAGYSYAYLKKEYLKSKDHGKA